MIRITESEITTIPAEDEVSYRVFAERIRKNHRIKVISEGYIPPKVFQNEDDERGMSVDWTELRNAQQTLVDHRTNRPNSDFGVISMHVGNIKKFKESAIDVIHDPQTNNHAHSLVTGFPSNIQRELNPRSKMIQTSLRNFFSNPINKISKWALFPKFLS